ncbi:hypothetical protein GCM10029992_46490 [Glycomyces albus]
MPNPVRPLILRNDHPRVIATDLDGTLLDGHGRLSPRNQKALLVARERGHLVVAVTARPPRSVERVPDLPGVIDAAICVNGSILLEPGTAGTRLLHHIPIPIARRLYEDLRAPLPGASFAIETGTETVAQSRFPQPGVHLSGPSTVVETGAELFDRVDTVVELQVFDPNGQAARMIEAARPVTPPEVVMWSWGVSRCSSSTPRASTRATRWPPGAASAASVRSR